MFIFKRFKVKRKDRRQQVSMARSDWVSLKALASKLKAPMSQVVHDSITVYAGFIYGMDHANSIHIQRDLDLVGTELKQCRNKLKLYIERFGEIDTEH